MKSLAFATTVALLGSVAILPAAEATIASTFDTDADGWLVVDLLYNGDYLAPITTFAPSYADGGNPGGHIAASDPSDQSFFFQAPARFLGNLGAYYGGTLAFDQRVSPTSPEWREDPDVILGGGGLQLLYRGAANPGGDWTSFSVSLSESGWHVGSLSGPAPTAEQFNTVLGDVSILRIRGEYIIGVIETTSLDNVVLTAVPEPGTWALMVGGLLGLAWRAHGRTLTAQPARIRA